MATRGDAPGKPYAVFIAGISTIIMAHPLLGIPVHPILQGNQTLGNPIAWFVGLAIGIRGEYLEWTNGTSTAYLISIKAALLVC